MSPKTIFFIKEALYRLAPSFMLIMLFFFYFKVSYTALFFTAILVFNIILLLYIIYRAKQAGINFNDERNHSRMLHTSTIIAADKDKILRLLKIENNTHRYVTSNINNNEDWLYLKSRTGHKNETVGFKLREIAPNKTEVAIKAGHEKNTGFSYFSKTHYWLSALRHINYFKRRLQNDLITVA